MSLTPLQKQKLRSKLSLSTELDVIARFAESGNAVTFGEILNEIGLRGHAILCFILSLPFLQPIPLAGLSTVIGLVIALIGALLAFNVPPKLPKRVSSRSISPELLLKVSEFGHRFLIRIERFIRPRGIGFQNSAVVRAASALLICACGFLLALPLPIPFSNAVPAWAIAITSLGIVERDGVLLVIGYSLFGIALLFFGALVILPVIGLQNSAEWMRGIGL
jgi:hypothetical protein